MSAALGPGRDIGLVRLLQLASPALPIGAYSYSQGLEWAIASGVVADAASARRWIGDMLDLVVAPGEGAVAWHAMNAADCGDWTRFAEWNRWFRASRDTAELRAETQQMGDALVKLAVDLELLDSPVQALRAQWVPLTLPATYALVVRGFRIPLRDALIGYIWSWLENQVIAAMKLVPLGQVAGQRLLLHVGARIPAAADIARGTAADDVVSFAPGLALASAKHETQYTRLFRS